MSRKKKDSEKGKIGSFFSSVAKTGKSIGKFVNESRGPCAVCNKPSFLDSKYFSPIVIDRKFISPKHVREVTVPAGTVRLYLHKECVDEFEKGYEKTAKELIQELDLQYLSNQKEFTEIVSDMELEFVDDSIDASLLIIEQNEEMMGPQELYDKLNRLKVLLEIFKKLKKSENSINPSISRKTSGLKYHTYEHKYWDLRCKFTDGKFLSYVMLHCRASQSIEILRAGIDDYQYPEPREDLDRLFYDASSNLREFEALFDEETGFIDNFTCYDEYINLNNLLARCKVLIAEKVHDGEQEQKKEKERIALEKKKKNAEKKAKAKKEAAEKKAKAKKEAAELKEVKLKQKAGMMKAGVPERIFSLWVEDVLTKSQMLKMLQLFGESISEWELELEYICETEVNRFSHIDHGRVMFCPEYVREIETIDERITFLYDLISEFPKAMVRYSFENPTNQEQLEFLKRISTNDDFYYLYLAIINDGFEIDYSAKLVNDYGFDKHLDALQEVIDGANWEGVAAKHGFLQL